jgi:hypothetical protein
MFVFVFGPEGVKVGFEFESESWVWFFAWFFAGIF